MPKKEVASFISEIVPGFFHFMINDGIHFRRDCYAIVDSKKKETVLIDPLQMDKKLYDLPKVKAIFLTAACHQRKAWNYRKMLKAKVYAPKGKWFKGKPDYFLRDNMKLPGNVIAIHSPGPTDAHYSFYSKNSGGAIICGDLLVNEGRGNLKFVESQYQDNPDITRKSVKRLLGFDFKVLCFNHGPPMTKGAKKAIRKVLREDNEFKD